MKKEILDAGGALFVSTILTGFGVVLFIHANLGSDTITVFIDGVRCAFQLSLGSASRIYNIGALLLALLLSRKDIGWTSIIYALSTGFVMDFFDPLLIPFQFAQSSILIRLFLIVIGQACIIISFALLIRFGNGMDQLDAVAYGICRRISISYAVVRTSMDVILLISGYLLGGVIGIGSIIAMATTGVGINLLLKTPWLSKQEIKKGNIHEKIA